MKSLSQFISEAIKLSHSAYDGKEFFDEHMWKLGYEYKNATIGVPTLEELENAYFTTSNITGDPSFGAIGELSFDKVEKNKWYVINVAHSAMGETYTNDQLLNMITKTKEKWFLMLRYNKK